MKEIIVEKYLNQNGEISIYPYKQMLIIFVIVKYFWEQYINLRQIKRNLIKDIPEQLKSYQISLSDFILGQSYSFDKMAFQMLSLSIRMAADCLCIMCNILPFIWDNVHQIFPFIDMHDQFQRAMSYILIEAFISKAFHVPLSSYQTFIIQKKYGFTNKTLDLFIYDLFVQAILMIIIFPPILFGYLRIVQYGGDYFYLFLQIFAFIVTILLGWIHPNLISPLFNQFKPLTNSNVIVHLNHLAVKVDFPLKKILWMNGSVRSAHSNAYFYGFGKTKVIVLYDTLMAKLNPKEITSVVCHQLGHWASNHSVKKLFVYLVEVLSLFYIFSFFLENQEVFLSFGFKQKSTFIGTALFFHLFQPLASIFDTVLLVLTRKFEFEADIFACRNGYGEELKNSLIKLFKQSTATVKPDSLYAWLKHSHPTVHQRVSKIEQYEQKRRKKLEEWQAKDE